MILVLIRMRVIPEKKLELSQTVSLLSGSIRREKGCRRCDFCQNVERKNELCLIEEWESREDLLAHLKSEHFRVLRGAMNLLQDPYEMRVHTFQSGMNQGKGMPTNVPSKSIDQLLAEADDLIKQFKSEFIENLEEDHRLQFEAHAQRFKKLKAKVKGKGEKEGTLETSSSVGGMHEAILDIVKAMKELTGYLA